MEIIKYNACCFTGHRKIDESKIMWIKNSLIKHIELLVRKNVIYFIAGGALGFDTLAALSVIEVKKKYPHIQLILSIPCRNQTRGWKNADINIYNRVLSNADEVIYISENYYRGCMHKRNRFMVDNSAYCICYVERMSGGSYYTAEYARKQGSTIINLNDILFNQ